MGVVQSLQFLFGLQDLGVEIVALALEFLALLTGLDDVVGLTVFALGFDFAAGGLRLLHQRLVLDAQVLDHVHALGELDGDLY